MYIVVVPNRKTRPAILLREGWREGRKTRQRTIANLSDWPQEKIEALRRLLRNEPVVSPQDLLTRQKSVLQDHMQATLEMIARLQESVRLLQKCLDAVEERLTKLSP